MRLHRNLVLAVMDALYHIFNDDVYADKQIAQTLKRDKRWGSHDRGFIAETTYDIVRWKRLYAEIAELSEPFKRDELPRLFAVWATLKGISLPDWGVFEGTPTRRIKGRFDELKKTRAIGQSIPDWLDELGQRELGAMWEIEIAALNQQAPVVLRANSLKTTPTLLRQRLLDEQIVTKVLSDYPDALELEERKNVFATSAFKEGLFEVQDASSQEVARMLDVASGMRVVDACAGAGGKTLHLAALMENKGNIVAMDIYQNKLNELKRRARRAGAHNIETRLIDSTKAVKKLHGKADRVLIDAPCSGLGVLKRNPDAKWKLQPEFIENIKQTQAQLLKDYAKMVKPGGKMVYATCSVLSSENEQQVADFLTSDEGSGFIFDKEKKIFAHQSGYDGFYMALLERIEK